MKPIPIKSLVGILAYLHNEELRHYCDCRLSGDDGNHIYLDVLKLLRWVSKTYARGEAQSFADQCLIEYEAWMSDVRPAAQRIS
jgi:hypothetical protein